MSENLLLGYVIDNKQITDTGWKASIIGLMALILPDFEEVTCYIKDLSPKQLEFFGAESGNIENITEINLIYTKLSSEERDGFFFEVNYSNRSCTLNCMPLEFCNYNIIYDKDCSPLHYLKSKQKGASFELSLKDVSNDSLRVVITMHNANYEFSIAANYIPKIKGYKLNVRGIGNINYYCIDNREVDQKTWDLARRGTNTDDYIEINIKSDIVSEYLTDTGEYTIFNNTYFLNPSKPGDTLVIPNDCKNLYCSRYRLSKFKSVVIPPSLEKFWYYYMINFYNEEDVRGDTRDHKDTKFYFSKTAPASQLYEILRDCIVDYYSNCGYCKCAYEKYENKIETAKTVEELLDIINGTDYIKIELY